MLAAAWTLQIDGHVRVDIFYAQANPRTKALIDLVGAVVFLLAGYGHAWRAVTALCRTLLGDI